MCVRRRWRGAGDENTAAAGVVISGHLGLTLAFQPPDAKTHRRRLDRRPPPFGRGDRCWGARQPPRGRGSELSRRRRRVDMRPAPRLPGTKPADLGNQWEALRRDDGKLNRGRRTAGAMDSPGECTARLMKRAVGVGGRRGAGGATGNHAGISDAGDAARRPPLRRRLPRPLPGRDRPVLRRLTRQLSPLPVLHGERGKPKSRACLTRALRRPRGVVQRRAQKKMRRQRRRCRLAGGGGWNPPPPRSCCRAPYFGATEVHLP